MSLFLQTKYLTLTATSFQILTSSIMNIYSMYWLHIQKWYLNKQLCHRMPWEKLDYFTLPAIAATNEEASVNLTS